MHDIKKDFSFMFPTELEYGVGKIEVLKNKTTNIERALIVTDEGIEKAGILERVESNLQHVDYEIYKDIEPNPKDFHVEEGAEIVRQISPEAIIAVGGGSPIDCAKGIGALISEKGKKISEYYGKNTVQNEILYFIAVPTTAGTGSEVTFSSVITDSDSNVKKSIRSPYLAPDVSILDPELTLSLPKELTAYSGMDAFTHAVEAYTATTATSITNAFALYSMEMILNNIERAVQRRDDIEAKAAMLMGSTLAGVAFNHSDVASVHCMAESLGGFYDAPHGLCNSIILPYVMEYNMEYCLDKYAKVAEFMGTDFETIQEGAQAAVENIKILNEKLDIPSIEHVGMKERDIEKLSEMSVNNLSNESNPRPMSKDDYLELFHSIYRGDLY